MSKEKKTIKEMNGAVDSLMLNTSDIYSAIKGWTTYSMQYKRYDELDKLKSEVRKEVIEQLYKDKDIILDRISDIEESIGILKRLYMNMDKERQCMDGVFIDDNIDITVDEIVKEIVETVKEIPRMDDVFTHDEALKIDEIDRQFNELENKDEEDNDVFIEDWKL